MPEIADLDIPADGKLASNIARFARALRAAGLPVGPGHVVTATRAVAETGFAGRSDFYWTLHACLVARPEHSAVYAQVFRLFWRDPRYLERMMAYMLPALRGLDEERAEQGAETRAAEALLAGAASPAPEREAGEDAVEVDASATMSGEERLKTLDFEQMTAAEAAEARRVIARLTLPARPLVTRRTAPAVRGRQADWRRTMRAAMRQGGEVAAPARRARRTRPPDLVALCDISGSMAAYSRMMLHFLHAVANAPGTGWGKVHAFTFGTRLTNITRHLAARDADRALAAAGAEAQDWEGGTRIGACLRSFNRDWSRRVLGRGAVVLLISDGLDRGDTDRLAAETDRLRRSCRRLVWVNPLLRWEGFAPKAGGMRAMVGRVDSLQAGHDIASLADLAAAVAGATPAGPRRG